MSEENKLYEISYLAKNEAGKEAVLNALSSISASDIQEVKYSEMKLAYPIKKISLAFFGCITFRAATENVSKINNILKLKEEVLRFIVITPPIKAYSRFNAKSRPVEQSNITSVDTSKESEVIDIGPSNEAGQEGIEKAQAEFEVPYVEAKPEIDDEALNEKLEEILSGTK